MYEKIVVPLDGSELAEVALPYAEELSGKMGSNISLIYVAEPVHYCPERMYQTYLGQMAQITKQLAERYVDRPQKMKAVINVEPKILLGDPAEEIINYAERNNADLIVMATHGQSGLKRWPMGSVADRVVRNSKRPVWLIRAKNAQSNMRQKDVLDMALVPLDGSKESEAVLPYIEELATGLKADVTLLQVLPLGYHGIGPNGEGYEFVYYRSNQIATDKAFAQDYLDKIAASMKKKGLHAESQVRFGSAAEEIIKLAADIQADVVAMSTHGRSGIGRWVLGSVAERVLNEGYCPLLLVRPLGVENVPKRESVKKRPVAARS